jgi:4-amino-4-deoxy-L-arabinose transferase-like glycosyltransferase
MPARLLTARERAIWLLAFVGVAALLVLARFRSTDPDSALYASLSTRLAAQPIARWIAPEWWGLWPATGLTGYFREHPSGLFLIPAAMARLGVPGEQAAYVFGVGAGLVALLLAGQLVTCLTAREDGRAALVLLQVMPLAFIFRIRDNHEYPMLVCLLAGLVGLEGVARSWWKLALVAVAFAGGLLVKGVFVVLVLLAAGLWIAIDPTCARARWRQLAACGAGLAVMAAVAWAYDITYQKVTGDLFWTAYWRRQLGPMSAGLPAGELRGFVRHAGFYLLRLLYHPAPWSLVLLWASVRPTIAGPWRDQAKRGLLFVLVFAALSVLLLSVASRFAERYAFSATYMIGAAGIVVAVHRAPRLRRGLTRLETAVPALPAALWVTLIVLRVALGPWLPRIGG